jgi:hypothetical protein
MTTFNGVIKINEIGNKIVKVEDHNKNQKLFEITNEFKIFDDSDNLKDGDEVIFTIDKKIYSDKTDLYAKILKIKMNDWSKILKDFLKHSHNHSLSDYQEYLMKYYNVPQEKNL